jgi:phosphatidylserine/phosphatidylglycerophosphate/cardiolipin synthase-like enzyme
MRLTVRIRCIAVGSLVALALLATAAPAQGLERLCDSSFETCRTEVIARIRAEVVGIDVATWFFEDSRFSNELIARWRAGVRVRVIGDTRANAQHPLNATILDQLASAGVPVRRKISSGIEHWKLMLFAGQNVAYFGSANFSADAWAPYEPYVNFVDETIYGTDDPDVVNTFRTKFDDVWINTTSYGDYANVTSSNRVRRYAIFPTDPELNFAPASGTSSYRTRSVNAYNAETQRIDVIMYRITDQAHVDALIRARQRGVPVRFYTEQQMYRDRSQLWHSMSVDKMYMAGITIRDRAHQGLNHQKTVLLYSQGMTIFGSSNMTSRSSDSQHEHNYFTRKAHIFDWFRTQFDRKWFNRRAAETKAFVPLPPDTPSNRGPADGAVGVATTGVRLSWYGGPWAHVYDIYFGTSSDPPLFAANVALGPSETTSQNQSFALPTLAPGTTYYWKIHSKTMANLGRTGATRRFTTTGSGSAPTTSVDTVVIWMTQVTTIRGNWRVGSDSGAGGVSIWNPDRGAAKIAPALASPANYFEVPFYAEAGRPYHLWIRMRAQGNSLGNDSVHVQFTDAVTSSGAAYARIGTSSSAEVVLQAGPGGAAPSGWGWTDNGWGSLGPHVYFTSTRTRTLRVQQREDGAIIDQIVLSPSSFLTVSPGARRNDTVILPQSNGCCR